MAPVHGRMPVLLDGEAPAVWLDPAAPRERLTSLFRSDPLPLEISPDPRGG
jgi:putative SOS response-associated peptidase YedK